MADERKTLGEIIRELRNQKGLSLSELARQAGISKSHLYQIERGRSAKASGESLLGIAFALGTSIAYLLGAHSVSKKKEDIKISESLREFARLEQLDEEEVIMLARIRYKGRQPQTLRDWQYLFESIKRSVYSR